MDIFVQIRQINIFFIHFFFLEKEKVFLISVETFPIAKQGTITELHHHSLSLSLHSLVFFLLLLLFPFVFSLWYCFLLLVTAIATLIFTTLFENTKIKPWRDKTSWHAIATLIFFVKKKKRLISWKKILICHILSFWMHNLILEWRV